MVLTTADDLVVSARYRISERSFSPSNSEPQWDCTLRAGAESFHRLERIGPDNAIAFHAQRQSSSVLHIGFSARFARGLSLALSPLCADRGKEMEFTKHFVGRFISTCSSAHWSALHRLKGNVKKSLDKSDAVTGIFKFCTIKKLTTMPQKRKQK